MASAELAFFGGILVALITAISAVAIAYYQRRSALREEHRLRAFDRHLPAYERIFTACRLVQDALSDYRMMDRNVTDRSDPFLLQVLDILRACADQYYSAVDWRRNPGMLYLDTELENKCRHLRELLRTWLSQPRLSHGDVVTVHRNGKLTVISSGELRLLSKCDYQELRIERKIVVVPDTDQHRRILEINKTAEEIVRDLKTVLAH
jgi:hypothetical protein